MTDDTTDAQHQQGPAAGWYRDPTGQGEARYWNGAFWTDSVSRGGVTIAVPMPPQLATTPPVPGTEYVAPAPTQAPPVTFVTQSAPPPARPRSSSSSGTIVGLIVGAVLILVAVVVLTNVLGDDEDEPIEPPTTEQPAQPEPTEPAEPTSSEPAPTDG